MNVIPNIPIVYNDKFPEDYPNTVQGWNFDYETVKNNIGKLLTLDIDFGVFCSLNCPACFRKSNSVDKIRHELKYEDLVNIILQAKELGLRSVKFLGAGDPIENERFLEFLRFLKANDIIPLIFTKGHVIGDDSLVKKYFSQYGITTGEELVREFDNCNCSLLVNVNTFDENLQTELVGGDAEFIKSRTRALELLANQGFNKCLPTRLAIINSPITKQTVDESLEIYKWARVRNLYCVTTPTMISGRANKDDSWKKITPSEESLVKLYSDMYKFNIETGLQTPEQIEIEGISAYAGAHPCNQTSTGLYVTLNGVVLSCPGSELNVEGNIWKNSLKEIWKNSMNYRRSGQFNCKCIAKQGKSIPDSIFEIKLCKLAKSKTY